MITPWIHQIEVAEKGYKIIQQYALVYLAMEERTGKSLAALLIAEQALVAKVLIVTKKKALKDWEKLLNDFDTKTRYYRVVTYTQLHNVVDSDWDLLIVDEAHNYISGFPNPSAIWKLAKKIIWGKPIIYLSATPHAQTYAQLYHQFALSKWSPWAKYKSFRSWHAEYGESYTIWIKGRQLQQWDKVDDERIKQETAHLFITKTRKELGFKKEPKDKLHYVPLADNTKRFYNEVMKHKIFEADGKTIECDTNAKLRSALHMIEGGVAKYNYPALNTKGNPVIKSEYLVLSNTEKIDYILEHWGDSDEVAIMYNYIAEGIKLNEIFKHARILQATSYAEGVDLSHIKHLIIYSQDWSTARHSQRRARQANWFREHDITVHFLLVKKGISEECYETVSINKTNYVDSRFQRNKL